MTAAALLDEEAPWAWSKRDVLGLLSDRQRRYVELLPEIFRVKTAAGRVVPYDMQPFQVWFHAHAPLAMARPPNRLAEKGRGLGFTQMVAMDFLLLAHRSPRVHIPVAGRQSSTGDEFIQKCHDLMADTVVDGFFDPDETVTSIVRLGNGSTIEPIPGGNPNALRSKRAPAACSDEHAFQPYPEALWRAMRGTLSEGGQVNVLSTHDGSGTHFFHLLEDVRAGVVEFKRFYAPIHDPDTWDRTRPLPEQLAPRGPLRLIAPWLDRAGLEQFRREDPLGYEQENLCRVMDETLNLIPQRVVDAAHDPFLEAWERPVAPDLAPPGDAVVSLELAQLGLTVPVRPHAVHDAAYLAVDFAREGDLSAYTALTAQPEGLLQRWLSILRGVKTPLQNAYLRVAVHTLRPVMVLIDMTGEGAGLYDYAVEELRDCIVVGIHFGSSVDLAQDQSVPVKKAMALNLSHAMTEGRIRLLGTHAYTKLQRRHLGAVRRADLDAPKKATEGHADIFWALAMAAWGPKVGGAPAAVVRRPDPAMRAPRGVEPGDWYDLSKR